MPIIITLSTNCRKLSAMCASCPSGFTQAIPGSCLMVTTSTYYDFSGGDTYCQSVGARLTSMNDANDEYAILSKKISIVSRFNHSVSQAVIAVLLSTDHIYFDSLLLQDTSILPQYLLLGLAMVIQQVREPNIGLMEAVARFTADRVSFFKFVMYQNVSRGISFQHQLALVHRYMASQIPIGGLYHAQQRGQ